MRILGDHSAKIVPPMTARTAVKPTLTEVEIALLSFVELLVLLAVAPVPVPVADPDDPPELPDGVLELEAEFLALAWKAAKVLLLFALTAKTIPCMQ